MAFVSKRSSAASLAVAALGLAVAFQACESPEAFHVSAGPPLDGGGDTPGLAGAPGTGGMGMIASGGISGVGSGGRGSGGAVPIGGRAESAGAGIFKESKVFDHA